MSGAVSVPEHPPRLLADLLLGSVPAMFVGAVVM
jgi:hypothetical protein